MREKGKSEQTFIAFDLLEATTHVNHFDSNKSSLKIANVLKMYSIQMLTVGK